MKPTWIAETQNLTGQSVELSGWVDSIRDHGKVFFLDLRDRTGVIQCIIAASNSHFEAVRVIKPESVICLRGTIQPRPEKLVNPSLATGAIELAIEALTILALAETPPLPLNTDGYDIDEAVRLRYRYLDLRRPRLQRNLIERTKVSLFIRNWLSQRGFIEIETPNLTRSTPEGARDYLVPSRIDKGKFYALPQSPQQYKQLLMVAGLERYFQIARCFRDEDPRGDRQAEFTQLDLEASFVNQADILNLTEQLFTDLVATLYPKKKITAVPFPRIPYRQALDAYGSDKPDIRQNRDDPNELGFCFIVDFPMFETLDDGSPNPMHHPFTQPKLPTTHYQLPTDSLAADKTKENEKIIEFLRTRPLELLSLQHDLVCNGFEIGGGSIRTTDPAILLEVFKVLGHDEAKVRAQFGHLLEAFRYGVPPHGGIAPGLDRLLMILRHEPNIREVIAFPKTSENRDPMMGAPGEVEPEQLRELGLEIGDEKQDKKINITLVDTD